MTKYRDAALAAYAARESARATAEQAARDALVTRAKSKAAPLWAGADGKPILDPAKQVRAEHVDAAAGLVVLAVLDPNASSSGALPVDVTFAVYPDREEPLRLVTLVDGEWQRGPSVGDLDDVGAALTGDA